MKIGIIGLGLIGASLAKAIKLKTPHVVLGYDKNQDVNIKAKMMRVVDEHLGYDNLGQCDMIILALWPQDTVNYLRDHGGKIKPDTIVLDCCGVKRCVCDEGFEIARKYGFTFVGGHPMAGLEKFGYENSKASLFDGASMVLTAPYDISIQELDAIKNVCTKIGFGNIEICTPKEHDRIIAFTSQLAHIISNAYIKSPTASEHFGFSAGSYRDLSRVAKLDEKMWTQLFFCNKDCLAEELDRMIDRLCLYSKALHNNDTYTMQELLREGRERKEYIDGKENAFWK